MDCPALICLLFALVGLCAADNGAILTVEPNGDLVINSPSPSRVLINGIDILAVVSSLQGALNSLQSAFAAAQLEIAALNSTLAQQAASLAQVQAKTSHITQNSDGSVLWAAVGEIILAPEVNTISILRDGNGVWQLQNPPVRVGDNVVCTWTGDGSPVSIVVVEFGGVVIQTINSVTETLGATYTASFWITVSSPLLVSFSDGNSISLGNTATVKYTRKTPPLADLSADEDAFLTGYLGNILSRPLFTVVTETDLNEVSLYPFINGILSLPSTFDVSQTSIGTAGASFPSLQSANGIVVKDTNIPAVVSFSDLGTVFGDVNVTGNQHLCFVSLPALSIVAGDLNISDNDALQSISAPLLQTIAGSLLLDHSASLGLLNLHALTTVQGNISITTTNLTIIVIDQLFVSGDNLVVLDNSALTYISMRTLSSVSGDLAVSGNQLVQQLYLKSLATVSGSLTISVPHVTTGSLVSLNYVGDDLTLANFDMYNVSVSLNVNSVGRDVWIDSTAFLGLYINVSSAIADMTISNNAQMVLLNMPLLPYIRGTVMIFNDPVLTYLGFPSLTHSDQPFSLVKLSQLPSVRFPLLRSATSLIIQLNPSMTLLSLPVMTVLTGDILISGNSALSTIEIPLLASVAGMFSITTEPKLARLDMPTLTLIVGSFSASASSSLTVINAPRLSSAGGLSVTANPVLNLANFTSLSLVWGTMVFQGCPSLATVDVAVLTFIASKLQISNCGLSSLRLDGLMIVQDSIFLTKLANVTSVIANANIRALQGSLSVTGTNASALVATGLTSVGGSFIFTDNSLATQALLPALTLVGGVLLVQNCPNMRMLNLNMLAFVQSNITFSSIGVTGIRLTSLAFAGTSFAVLSNVMLTDISVPTLTFIASQFYVSNNAALLTVEIPQLTFVGASSVVLCGYPSGFVRPTSFTALTIGKACLIGPTCPVNFGPCS